MSKPMPFDFKACDRYDYLIAVSCGAVAGVIDIFFVGTPANSALVTWTDGQTDKIVMTFAEKIGWSRKNDGKGIASAIGFLERKFPVNYDHQHTAAVNNAFKMSTKNHHLKSLSHSPSPLGLLCSILDQFQNKATFISDGKLIRLDTTEKSFRLEGSTFHAKLFAGFCNWIGHIMSDVAGSSGGRGATTGRGSGVAIPFFELFQLCNFGSFQIGNDRQNLATLMTRAFQEGYDLRFGAAMAIPVVLNEVLINCLWALKRHFYHELPWSECIPNKRHASLRIMLLVGTTTLCLFDGADGFIKSGGNPLVFVLHLNIIAWFRLVTLILREIMITWGYNYSDLLEEFKKINQALAEYLQKLQTIDFESYENEVLALQQLNSLCQSGGQESTDALYRYLIKSGEKLQFHNFEEFDTCLQDPDFVLEI